MEKRFFTCILVGIFSLLPSFLFSQSPQSIPYQAVVRNADGTAMSNAALTMIFKIHDVTATGTIVYQESHTTASNAKGLVVLQVGQGQASVGTFANINWGSGAKFLHVLMNAGNGEIDLGTQQMMSVPYALYAEKSGGSVPTGSAPGELMYWNGQGWTSIPPGGYGQALVMCDGVPTWGGCLPKLGGVQLQSIVPSSSPDENNNYIFVVSFKDEIVNSGIPGATNNAFINSGFYLSPDSLFIENVQNLQCNYVYESGYSSQNPFYFEAIEGVSLQLSATYYVKAYCQNNFGVGFSQVVSFTTPSSVINGCIDPQACNYNASADAYDGSCLYQGSACDDGVVSTMNDAIDSNCSCVGILVVETGAQLLPGNTTCAFEHISVTGCGGQTSLTYDDRSYDLVEIGGQCWFADNLATDQYHNGDMIPTGLDDATWLASTSGAYAIYNDDPANDSIYGKLYNWYTTVDSRGVCPAGWHVPTDCDWMYLESVSGMSLQNQMNTGWRGNEESNSLKSSSGWYANTGTNSTGFSAVPSGKKEFLGNYVLSTQRAFYWTSTGGENAGGSYREFDYGYGAIFRNSLNVRYGHSIRCLKD